MLSVLPNTILSQIIGWVLIVGTIFSYMPQYYRLHKKKNTDGISEFMLISGSISSITNIIGAIQININNLLQCNEPTYNNCYNIIMPIIQLFAPGFCILVFYIYFIYYTKHSSRVMFNWEKHKFFLNFQFTITIIILLIIFTIIQDTVKFVSDTIPQKITGEVLNIISAIFSLLMWIPQIIKTKQLKTNGSLSIIALIIHGSGCGLTIIYQFIYNSQSIWVVLCYIVAFICEFSIVFMCIYYNRETKIRRFKGHLLLNENL